MTSEPAKTKPNKTRAYTIVLAGLFVVVTFFTLIPFPNYKRPYLYPTENACIANLKQIDGAKATWALEHGITNGSFVVSGKELYGVTNYIRDEPTCPMGGTYQIGLLGQKPRCTLPGHTL
jgi:hypothetical protein